MRALLSALLLQLCCCAAAAAPPSCSRLHNLTASTLAVQHINQHHSHGYKFRLDRVSEVAADGADGAGCAVRLQLLLKETTCPVVDPRELQDCGFRTLGERAVVANCSVLMTVRENNTTVSRYDCQTHQEMSDREMMKMCPDCSKLLALSDPRGLKAIQEAVAEFNKNISNQRVYVLGEVGRISVGYVSSTGMNYYSEFLLVETVCPSPSRILHQACRPLCAHRARHAFCRSSYSQTGGLRLPLRCEFFPPKNSTALGPGEEEPTCAPRRQKGPPGTPHAHGHPPHKHPPHGHPPQGHRPPPPPQGPPPHGHKPPPPPQGPPSHGPPHPPKGPPPHGHPPHDHSPPLPPLFPHLRPSHCRGPLAAADPALHPICPWPDPAGPHPRGEEGQASKKA